MCNITNYCFYITSVTVIVSLYLVYVVYIQHAQSDLNENFNSGLLQIISLIFN